ncbi:hypothetical protein EG327_009414 [Venturia inaequalis]|uniref:Uncharacterized protein n=1 Tax=Venturia inaequalis TaxID=5025 RepID=A0A8H3VQP5_VENIN|nr:hypothetical protein EG327_009414 [Venturia inaequalis]
MSRRNPPRRARTQPSLVPDEQLPDEQLPDGYHANSQTPQSGIATPNPLITRLRRDTFSVNPRDYQDQGQSTPTSASPTFIINEHTPQQIPLAAAGPKTPEVGIQPRPQRVEFGQPVPLEIRLQDPVFRKTFNRKRVLDQLTEHPEYERYGRMGWDASKLLKRHADRVIFREYQQEEEEAKVKADQEAAIRKEQMD